MKKNKGNSFFQKLLSYERIYCFPNKYGFLGFALFLVMIAAGATFQNNLVYMMAFLYLGFGLIAILQTARNIRDVTVTQVHVESGFPGQRVKVRITLKNPAQDMKLNVLVKLALGGQELQLLAREIPGQNIKNIEGEIQLPLRRGEHPIQRVGLSTTYPYLLFRAWKYTKLNAHVFVYPAPVGRELDLKNMAHSEEDFSGHKIYEPGDNPSRLDWKIFSRRQEHYIRQFHDGGDKEIQLLWEQTSAMEYERRLSQYSYWIVAAENNSMRYDLNIPGFRSGSGLGSHHFVHCMEALAKAKNAS